MHLPKIGFGTYKLTGESGQKSITEALQVGYRLLDTAAYYDNEKDVAIAVERAEIPRNEITIMSKVWKTDLGYDATRRAVEKSMQNLCTAKIDVYLIHWPASQALENNRHMNAETWRALENTQADGQIKTIGVSNFLKEHLTDLFLTAHQAPACNEIEFHPGYTQPETAAFCTQHGIQLLGWSPLARGAVFSQETIQKLAQKHAVTPGQICLRYATQKGVIPLPKASTQEKMKENKAIFHFSLSPEELAAIDALPEMGFSGYHPCRQ